MAIAGKVAITTGGEWSATVAYDKLVVVTYNNNVYLSIKPSTGVAPTDTEYWMLLIENVTQEQYDAIINGTTPVGNANKLGGKSASEYALISQLFSNAETYRGLDFNTATETKIYSSMGNPSGDGAKNYPIDYTGMLIVFGGSVVSQKYVSFNGFVYERSKLNHADYAWTEWKQTATTADLANYLPLSGGTVSGNLAVALSGLGSVYSNILNTARSVYQEIDGNGAYWLYDATNSKSIIHSTADCTTTFNGTATGNLPLTGGTINGGDNAVPLILSRTVGDYTEIGFKGHSGGLGYLGMSGVDNPVFENSARNAVYSLHHDGNSAKVAIQSTAPTDTTSLWVDSTNKKTKAYIDGAWTALA